MIEIKKLRRVVDKVFTSEKNKEIRQEQSKFLKYYKGEFWKDEEKNLENVSESKVYANLFFSTVMTIAPMLTDNKPIWSIRAKYPFMHKYIQIYKKAAEALWYLLDMDHKLFRCVIDSLVMKYGIFKVYFDPEKDFGGEVEVEVIDPRTFVIPAGYTDIWDAPWCGTVTRRPLSWVREKYPDRDDIKPDQPSDGMDYANAESYELGNEFVTIYEIYTRCDEVVKEEEEYEDKDGNKKKRKKDRKKYPNGRYLIFAKTSDKALVDKEYPYNHGKAPFIPLYDYMTPHDFSGMGEMDQIETLCLEYNLVLRKVAKHVRNWADPNWYFDPNCGIDPDKWKQDAPGGGQMFPVMTGFEPPRPEDPGRINQSATDFMSGIPGLIEEVSGVTDITKGMVTKKQRQSAHEISALVETAYTRTRQRVRNLEWTIKRVFQIIIELMQQFYTETRTMSIKQDDGVQYFDIANTKEFAQQATKPKGGDAFTQEQEAQDYEALISSLGDEENVYADFFIDIETNSTLPMDKQSLANLAIKLYEMKAIDNETLLEMVKMPRIKEIMERIQKMQQQQQPQPGPAALMQGGR